MHLHCRRPHQVSAGCLWLKVVFLNSMMNLRVRSTSAKNGSDVSAQQNLVELATPLDTIAVNNAMKPARKYFPPVTLLAVEEERCFN